MNRHAAWITFHIPVSWNGTSTTRLTDIPFAVEGDWIILRRADKRLLRVHGSNTEIVEDEISTKNADKKKVSPSGV